MDSKQLIGYMTRPERLKGEAVKEMEQLVADYPYFGIGQTLLAIAYQNNGDERYDSQLRRTAALMPNRDKLRLFTLNPRRRNGAHRQCVLQYRAHRNNGRAEHGHHPRESIHHT